MNIFITFAVFSPEGESENEFEPEPEPKVVATRGAGRKRAPPGEVNYLALTVIAKRDFGVTLIEPQFWRSCAKETN